MADNSGAWAAIGAAAGSALGLVAKSYWDRYVGWRAGVPIQTWKIRTAQLERRLSQFYWPLYVRLLRDDVVWTKVFFDLRPRHDRALPDWALSMGEDDRRKLSQEIEAKVLLPNHQEAVGIIRSSIHLANADKEFEELLARYVRHVDAYASLRSAGITTADPLDVGEPYPLGLTAAVEARMRKYQAEYEELLRAKGVLDLRRELSQELSMSRVPQ